MKMITKGESALLFYQLLSDNSLRKCMVISLESFTRILGLKRF